jgi:hypothetical protein
MLSVDFEHPLMQRRNGEAVVEVPETTCTKVEVEVAMRVEAAPTPKILDKGLPETVAKTSIRPQGPIP